MNANTKQSLAPVVFNPQVVEYSQTAASLAELQNRYGNLVFDVATPAGLKQAKDGRRELRALRTSLEELRTALKAPCLERGRLIDSEAKYIAAELENLEKPIDAIIKAEEARKEQERIEREQAEQKRVASIQSAIADIRALPSAAVGKTAAEILQMAEEADVMPIDAAFFGGYANEATIARNAAAAKLRQAHVSQLEHEAEQARIAVERAELERLRAEQAAREAQERIELERLRAEQVAREAQERIEREAREAAERKEREKQEAIARAERERQEAELRAQREALDKEQAELARQRAEIEAQKAAQAEAAKPAPVVSPAIVDATPVAPVAVAPSQPEPVPQLVQARIKLVQFRAEYGNIADLAGVVAAIDKFLGQ